MSLKIGDQFKRSISLSGNTLSTSNHFCRNILRLSKYYWPVLIPQILFEQFQRSSNIWFLLTSIFQMSIVEESPVSSLTTVAPLAALLLFSLIKESYADFKIKKKDSKINNSKYQCWNGRNFLEKKCEDIIVGDIVLVNEGQMVPADLLLLYIDDNKKSIYIDMSDLSGILALKEVKVIEKNSKIITINENGVAVNSNFHGQFFMTEPSANYNFFDGKVVISGNPGSVEVNVSNMAFKGSYLKGAIYSVGLVLYCGDDCKIQMNAEGNGKKSSQIEKKINVFIIHILIGLSLLIGFSLIPYYVVYFPDNNKGDSVLSKGYFDMASYPFYYYQFESKPNPIRPIITFALLYSYIVPISLFIAIDFIRWVQGHNIHNFIPGCTILNDKINADLGQVEYILAEKTETITEKHLSVSCLIVYDKELSRAVQNNIYTESGTLINDSFIIDDSEKLETLKQKLENEHKYMNSHHFIRCMCLSNSLVKDQNEFIGSYDENALINIAKFLDYRLTDASNSHYSVSINGSEHIFECILMSPFSTDLKKSRVIVYNSSENLGYIYIKGERSKTIETLSCPENLITNINNQVYEMNNKGYRTMILAYKELSREQIDKVRRKLKKIKQVLLNSEAKIEKLMSRLEKKLNFLGIACIEEKIRPETIDTVNSIKNAGIKLWMISGDSYSNTVLAFKKSEIMPKDCDIVHLREIKDSYTCQKVLWENISVFIFKERKKRRTLSSIIDSKPSYLEGNTEINEKNAKIINNQALFSKITDVEMNEIKLDREFDPRSLDFVVSVDGESLNIALNNENCRKMLLLLVVCAKSVCFSVLTPLDKGKIVKLLKRNLKFSPVVLSIGKGEGNISLFKESDIGISILEKNPSLLQHQADILLPHFAQLENLVLKHGHWFYYRISKLILLFFYKNFFLTFLLLGFFFACGYSGTSIFNSGLLIGYNLIFTTICVVYIGVFDKDLVGKEITQNLQIYMVGIMGMYFNISIFVYQAFYAAFQAGIFLFIFFYFHGDVIENTGRTDDLEMFGTVIFISLVFTVLLQIILKTSVYSVGYFTSQFLCVASLVGYIFYASYNFSVGDSPILGIRERIGASPLPFFNIFFSSTICVIATYIVDKFRELFNPGIIQKLQSVHEDCLFFDRIKLYSKSLGSMYKDSVSWNSVTSAKKFAMGKYTKIFKDSFIEKEFKTSYIKNHIWIIRTTVTILWVLLIMWSGVQIPIIGSEQDSKYSITTYILAGVFSIFVFLIYTSHFERHYEVYISAGFTIGIFIKFAIEVSFNFYSVLASSLVPMLSYILLNIGWWWMNLFNALNIVLTLVSVIIYKPPADSLEGQEGTRGTISSTLMVFLVSITIISAFIGYHIEYSKRKEFKLKTNTFNVVDRVESILSLLLPPFVKNRVNEGARFIAVPQEEVTILFCDIYGFEEICQTNNPKSICEFLDKLFQIFDSLCESMGVTKIETVGKTYMACAGLKESEQELASKFLVYSCERRVIELALSILQEVEEIRLPDGQKLQVKIGIHTGSVVAGVVGYHKPQFSLVGDTVNTASRMCSTLTQTNLIQISSNTHEKVKGFKEYEFEHHEIEVKGKGKMETYTVTYKDPSLMNIKESAVITTNEDMKASYRITQPFSIKLQLEKDMKKISSSWKNLIFYLKCRRRDKQFQNPIRLLKSSRQIIFLTILISIITYCVVVLNIGLFIKFSDRVEEFNFKIYLGIKFVSIIFLSFILYFLNRVIIHWYYSAIIIVICLVSLVIDFVPYMKNSTDQLIANYVGIEIMFVVLIFCHTSGMQVHYVFCYNICVFVPWIYIATTSSNQAKQNIANLALTASFCVINCVAIIMREQTNVNNNYLKKKARAEIRRTKKLLSQMMPPVVLSRLKNNLSYSEILQDVTILFADIVGFTNWSANRTPEEIIKMLYRLFKRFDKKCIFYDIYKVCTIGDCYVVLGYSGKQERDPWVECLNVVNMAKSMIKIINKQNKKHECDLNMRIGIHTGSITGGIIGSGVVRYDIWGQDVLIANKIESSGKPGKIHVSKSTKKMIEELHCQDPSNIREDLKSKYPVDFLVKYLEEKCAENEQNMNDYRDSLNNYEDSQRFFDFWQEHINKNVEKCKKMFNVVEIETQHIQKYREIKMLRIYKKLEKLTKRKEFFENRRSLIEGDISEGPSEIEKSAFFFESDKKISTGKDEKINTYFIEDFF